MVSDLLDGATGRQELMNVVAADEWVFSEHLGRETHTGPLVGPSGELSPTGRAVELRIGEVYRIEDGKIALMRAYYDSSTMMRQLGVFPPRPEVLARILLHQAKKLRSRLRERR
jgi:predicted ester cyclase